VTSARNQPAITNKGWELSGDPGLRKRGGDPEALSEAQEAAPAARNGEKMG